MNRHKLLALAAMLLVPLAACDEGTPPVPSGSIDGQVSIEGQGIDGVTVTLNTGTSTTTAGGGRFSFAGIDGGTYTVTISNFPADASFSSTSQPATIATNGQTATVNFSGTYIRTASIIGSVTVEGTGLSGVTVRLSGMADQSTQTDANGQYAFAQLRAGAYTVEVSDFDADVGFSNASQSVTLGVGETGAASFDGTYVRTAGIIGRVSIEGNGLSGVTVSLSGLESRTATTDAAGQYAFAELRAGAYTVGISGFDADDHGFGETSRSVTVALGQTENVPFDGIRLRTAVISGRVAIEGNGLAGVTVNLSGAETRSATTDAAGQYTFAELRAGSYMIAISGYDAEEHEFEQTSWSGSVALGQSVNVPFDGTRLRTAGISGQVSVAGNGLPGVMVSLSGPASMMDTTNTAGQYAFSGLAAGTYTVTISGYDMEAFVFDETSKTVELMDDQAAIQNFMGDHAMTASISGHIFLDANEDDAFDMDEEDALGLAGVTVTVLGPGVTDVNAVQTDADGMFMVENLMAGVYRVLIRSGDLAAAMKMEDWPTGVMFGGSGEGTLVALTPGDAEMSNIPFNITMQTLTMQAMMGNGKADKDAKTGAMVEGVGIDLYPTFQAADAGRNQIGKMAMTDSTGTATFTFARAMDTSPGGDRDYVVFAKVAQLPHDDLSVTANEVLEITYSARKLMDAAEEAVQLLNRRAHVRYWVKNVKTDAGGDMVQEGWTSEVRSNPANTGSQSVKASDKRGMATFTDEADVDDLPMKFYIRLSTSQAKALGEAFMVTPEPSDAASMESAAVAGSKTAQSLLVYEHDGLTMPGDTVDLGVMRVKWTTQSLYVGVHHERDHIEGFDNQRLQSRDARPSAAARADSAVNIRLQVVDKYGTPRDWEYEDAYGQDPRGITGGTAQPRPPLANGLVVYSDLPANLDFVVEAEANGSRQIYGLRDVDAFMGSRRAEISRGDHSVGTFGEHSGTGPHVLICPLAERGGLANCSTFAYGYTNNVVTSYLGAASDDALTSLGSGDTMRVALRPLFSLGSRRVLNRSVPSAVGALVTQFGSVPDGQYVVSIGTSKKGTWKWLPGADTVQVAADDATTIGDTLVLEASLTHMKTKIEGTVANFASPTLDGTRVGTTVLPTQTVEGAQLTLKRVVGTRMSTVATAKTNSRGAFSFKDLQEGKYVVEGTSTDRYELRARNVKPYNRSPELTTSAVTTSYSSGTLPRWSYGDIDLGTVVSADSALRVLDNGNDADFVVLFKDGELIGSVTRRDSLNGEPRPYQGASVRLVKCGYVQDITASLAGDMTYILRSDCVNPDPSFTPVTVETDADGAYTFTGLIEGVYSATLIMAGVAWDSVATGNIPDNSGGLEWNVRLLHGPRAVASFRTFQVVIP